MQDVMLELNGIFAALTPSNLLKVSWIGENGKSGAEAEPKLFVDGNVGLLSFGILMEVDEEKYAKEVYEPLKALLDKYAEFVKQVDKSKAVVQKSLEKAQQLFDSLMQQYFG